MNKKKLEGALREVLRAKDRIRRAYWILPQGKAAGDARDLLDQAEYRINGAIMSLEELAD